MGDKVLNTKGMEYRFLGNTGMLVSVLSLGGWLTAGGSAADKTFKEIMLESWKHGINFFDVAEAYAGGKAETVLGNVLKEVGWDRVSYCISTKIFFGDSSAPQPNAKGVSRKHLMEAMNKCLKRLQLDYVDVIMAHRPDPLTPMEETVRAFTQIINDGKAHYWGTSEWNSFQIEHAHHIATKHNLIAPICDQPQYSLLEREKVEKDFAPLYKLYKYGTTVFSPLKQGFLSGKYNDGVPDDSRFKTGDMKHMGDWLKTDAGKVEIEKVKKLGDFAKTLNTDTATLALAWVIHNPNVSTCILGASKADQITRNMKALEVYKKLTTQDIQKIEDIVKNKPEEESLYGRWPAGVPQ